MPKSEVPQPNPEGEPQESPKYPDVILQRAAHGRKKVSKLPTPAQLKFIKLKLGRPPSRVSDERATQFFKYYQTGKKRDSEEDRARHKWQKTSRAGYILAEAVKDSFGEDVKNNASNSSEHPLAAKYMRTWAEHGPEIPRPITDDEKYSLELVHIPADGEIKSPRKDMMTVKAEGEAGSSWECALVTTYGDLSYQDKRVGHKIIFSNSSDKDGETITRDAVLEDIIAFELLLTKAENPSSPIIWTHNA